MPGCGHHSSPKALSWTKSHFNSGKHLLICPPREPSAIFQWAQKKELGYAFLVQVTISFTGQDGREIISKPTFLKKKTRNPVRGWCPLRWNQEQKGCCGNCLLPWLMWGTKEPPYGIARSGEEARGKTVSIYSTDTKGLQNPYTLNSK